MHGYNNPNFLSPSPAWQLRGDISRLVSSLSLSWFHLICLSPSCPLLSLFVLFNCMVVWLCGFKAGQGWARG